MTGMSEYVDENLTDPEDQPGQEGQVPEETEVEQDTTRLRVAGLPFNESFTQGDVVVTREGTDVPTDQAQEVINAAARYGIQIVVDAPEVEEEVTQ